MLLTALAIYVLSNVIVAVAPTFALVAVARALGGASHAVFFSVSIGYASRLVRPHLAGRALALVTLGASAGFVLGVPLTTSLGTAVGWRAAFLVLAGACTLAVLLTALLLPSVAGGGAPPDDAARGARRTALAQVTSANALAYLGHYTVYTYVSVLLLAAGLATAALGPALLLIGALGLIGAWYAAARLDVRLRQTTVVTLGRRRSRDPGARPRLPRHRGHARRRRGVEHRFRRGRRRLPDGGHPHARRLARRRRGARQLHRQHRDRRRGGARGARARRRGAAAVPYIGAALVVAALVVVVVARRAFPATQGEAAVTSLPPEPLAQEPSSAGTRDA